MDTDAAIAAARNESKGMLSELAAKNGQLTQAYSKKTSSAPMYFIWPKTASTVRQKAPDPTLYPPSEYKGNYVEFNSVDAPKAQNKLLKATTTLPSYEKYKSSKNWSSEYDACYADGDDDETVLPPGGVKAEVQGNKPSFFAWGLTDKAPAPTSEPETDATPDATGGNEPTDTAIETTEVTPAPESASEPLEASEYDAAFHWWSANDIAANKGEKTAMSQSREPPMGLIAADGAATWKSVYAEGTEGQALPEKKEDPDAEPVPAGKPKMSLLKGQQSNPSNFAWVKTDDASSMTSDYRAAFKNFGISDVPVKFLPKDEGVYPTGGKSDQWCSEYDATFIEKKTKKRAPKKVVISEEPETPMEEPGPVEAPSVEEPAAPAPEPAAVSEPEMAAEPMPTVAPAQEYNREAPKELIEPDYKLKPVLRSKVPKAPTPFTDVQNVVSRGVPGRGDKPFDSEYRGRFAWPGEDGKPAKISRRNNSSNLTGASVQFERDAEKTKGGPIRTRTRVNVSVGSSVVGNASSSAIGFPDYNTSKLDMASKDLSDRVKAHRPMPVPKPVIPEADRAVRCAPERTLVKKPRTNLSLSSNPVLTNRLYPTHSDRGAGRWTTENRAQYRWKKTPNPIKAI